MLRGSLTIAIVCASISRRAGGILPVMQAHAHELTRRGHLVYVHGVDDGDAEADLGGWAPATVTRHKALFARFGYAPDLYKAVREANVDIIHQHGLWLYPSLAVARWRERTRRPIVITTHGMLEPWALANSGRKKHLAASLFERSNLMRASCLHCPPGEIAGVRAFGIQTPIAAIPHGVDVFQRATEYLRPQWLPTDGRKLLLFLGRLHPKKGVRETLEAWAGLKASRPSLASQWRLAFAGWDDGGNSDALLAYAKALGVDDVLFPGPQFGTAKHAAFAYADAFILASHSEGLPISVLEAWAHSLPVFMTRGCNLPSGFTIGAAIEISNNPIAMASVLGARLGGDDLPLIGKRGRNLVESHYAWPAIGAELEAVYRWLVGSGDKPSSICVGDRPIGLSTEWPALIDC